MLADTANLIINLTLKDQATGQLQKTQTGLSGLQKAALGVATLGFGAMTKGALQAEEAQGKFMAATGKSREEAKKFVSGMDSLAGSAGAVGMSFEDIADTGTMVEQQFGTTGDATRDLTDDILKFAKVTGQDAEGAAADLEDTLSAFGLSADDAAGFMDKLVASNQKFGTEAGPETLSILNGMAPALTAMGMGLDDGVELLNAFEVAGLDAGSAQKGLQAAIKDLKPGENLDTLIAQIGAIEDPTKRAQKAIEIFGTKAGAGLAQVIKPGMTSLDDFGVSAEESAGRLDTAADNMLTTSDKIKGMLEKVGAGFRELGQEFGPLVTGVATAGPALAGVVSKIWLALPDDSGVKNAVSAAGTKIGGAFSAAVGAGALIGLPLAAGLIVKGISDEANKQNLPSQIYDFIFGTGADLQAKTAQYNREVDKALAEGLTLEESKQRARDWLASWYGPEAGARFAEQIEAMATDAGTTGGEALGDAMVLSFQQQQQNAAPEVFQKVGVQAIESVGKGVIATQNELAADARETVRFANQAMMREAENADKIGDALADGLLEGIPNMHDAWKQYIEQSKNALDPMKELAWAQARLSGDKLAEGLASKNPLTRRRAELMRDNLMAEIEQLQALMGQEGTQGSNSLGNNLVPGPAVAAARAIMQKLENIFSRNFTVGVGVKSGTGKGKRAAGENVGGGGRAHGGPVAGNSIYEVNELGAPEMLTAGGRNYLLMGRDSGHVSAFGSGGVNRAYSPPMTVNVNLFVGHQQLARVSEHFRRLQGGQVTG